MDSKPTFQIRMVGEGVTPESVSAGDLADFMTLIRVRPFPLYNLITSK